MLIKFTASNHRSIKEPVELSMVAVDADRPAVRHFERLHEGVLPVAAIYGPNASGKSNLLDALLWLSQAVGNSLRAWDEYIPRDPFRFAGYPQQPSLFGLDFLLAGIRYTYTLQLTETGVEFEALLSYPERRQRTLFVREGGELTFRRGLSGVGGLKDLLTPTTLALTLARRLEVPVLFDAAQFIANIMTPFIRKQQPVRKGTWSRPPSLAVSTRTIFLDAYRKGVENEQPVVDVTTMQDRVTARALLKFADLGIEDVEVVELPDPGTDAARLDLRLVHRVGEEKELFELRDESDGTQVWFRLLGPALTALTHGYPLVLDELDASLHPLLSARLLALFRSPVTNPRYAQLIFTSHDTSLLGELNRDEVWFTEKGEDGATRLTALAEFGGDRVRRSMNLERAYLHGRFGALPNLRDSDLLGPPEVLSNEFDDEAGVRDPQDSNNGAIE